MIMNVVVKQERADDGYEVHDDRHDNAPSEKTFFSSNVPGQGPGKHKIGRAEDMAYQNVGITQNLVIGKDRSNCKGVNVNVNVVNIKHEPEEEHFEAQLFDSAQFSRAEGDEYGCFQGYDIFQEPFIGQVRYYLEAVQDNNLFCKEEIDEQCGNMQQDTTVITNKNTAEDPELVLSKKRHESACSKDCGTAKCGIEGPPKISTTVIMTKPNIVRNTLKESNNSNGYINRARERDEPRVFSDDDCIGGRELPDSVLKERSPLKAHMPIRFENVPPISSAQKKTYKYSKGRPTDRSPIKTNPCSRKGKSSRAKSLSSSQSNLNFDKRLDHTLRKPSSCPNCDKEIDVHSKADTKEKPFPCSQCGKCFAQKGNLDVHLRIHTGEKPFQCLQCGNRFALKSYLKNHLRTHTGEKPFSCSICGKKFSQRNGLSSHMKTHTGVKPYHCSICDDNFACKNTLDMHVRTHTGEKPYMCSVCNKRFSQKSSLSLHMRTHSGEKSYHCSQCGTQFAIKNTLTVHLRTHTGEKPYQCSLCSKKFSQSSSRNTHMKTHTLYN